MYYEKNKARARTTDNEPTLTDQAGARQTDINVIVGQFKISGRVPGSTTAPMSGDFSNLPTDLRGMIEESRSLQLKRSKLPPQLREMPIEELLMLTPEKLKTILQPAEQPPKQEESK